ncbi:MAG: ATP-binding cassette, subfamily B, bacterial MsbA [Desulfobacteraceae bacterium Eth-SRB1]|nr:MAG: ATP-binding cassette, subfamily B, bacterial MsbA [Desulfobacteraceae bacterium Eth-SRB1]
MQDFFTYIKQGLSRKRSEDRLAGEGGRSVIRGSLRNLQPFIRRHWKKALLGAIIIMFTSLLSFPAPLIFRYIVDDVILSRQVALLAGAIILLAGILIVSKLMGLWEQFYFKRLEQVIILDIQHVLLGRTLRFPKMFFDRNETGYLMSRLSSDVEELRWFFSGTIGYIISNVLRFIGGLVFLFYLEWRLAIGVLIVIPGLFYIIRFFSGKMRVLGHESMEQEANVSSRLQELLTSIPLIKAFSTEDRTAKHIISEWRKTFQISLEESTVASVANLTISSMPWLAKGIVLALGAYWVINGQWTLGSLLAFLAYLSYVFGPAQFLATANLQIQKALAALERVSALFDITIEENVGVGRKVEKLKGKIEFREVSFSYDEREPVLENVSFVIKPGEQVAIVGPSGVGKTTLLSLMLCFYRPVSGAILFDDLPVADCEVSSLRSRIGYVSQSTLLLSGTVMENLRYGSSEAKEEDIIMAAKAAGIHGFIESLPGGYETLIGEKGLNLSEGEKQRLSLARALIKEPDILVLDEPASALDSITERSIFQALPDLVQGRTLVVVAHRLSTIRDSDRIFLLNENRLVGIGTHQTLLETNDYYRFLIACQQTTGR